MPRINRKQLQVLLPTLLWLVAGVCIPLGSVLNNNSNIVIPGIVAAVLGGFLTLDYFGLMAEPILRPRDPAVDRVKQLVKALTETTQVIHAIEKEVKARSRLAERLQTDVETHKRLLALEGPEVEAIAQTLRLEVQREGRRSLWVGFLVNALFFGLGVFVTRLLS